jgi:hypothetical protein
MMVKLIKNFLDLESVRTLTNWTLSNYKDTSLFIDAHMGPKDTVFSNRFATPITLSSGEIVKSNDQFEYPETAYIVQEKINKFLRLPADTYLAPIGKDGISTNITLPTGTVAEHIDPVWVPDHFTIHCNLITQKPQSGAITVIDGNPFEPEEGDMLIYAVSAHPHGVTAVEGDLPRVLWTFGFCVIPPVAFEIFK